MSTISPGKMLLSVSEHTTTADTTTFPGKSHLIRRVSSADKDLEEKKERMSTCEISQVKACFVFSPLKGHVRQRPGDLQSHRI